MAAYAGDKGSDFYAVLGLKKECTATELKNAYKKLALRWHPDRFFASGNAKFVEDAKKKFQNIQEAYSVLYDENKRFLYDIGVYDADDDDDENGMGDFLDEMVAMMSQAKPSEKGEESFEELQQLFEDMFDVEINNGFDCASQNVNTTDCSTYSSYISRCESSNSNNKRNLTEMNYGNTKVEDSAGFGAHFQSFCLGVGPHQDPRTGKGVRGGIRGGGGANDRRRNSRKQKVSSGCREVLSGDYSSIST